MLRPLSHRCGADRKKNTTSLAPTTEKAPPLTITKKMMAPSPTERHLLLHVQPEHRRIRGRMSNLSVRSSLVLPLR